MSPRRAFPIGTLTFALALVRCGSSAVAPSVGPPAADGGSDADFPPGEVTLSAQAGVGSALAYWAGLCGGANATCTARLHTSLAGTEEFVAIADFEPPPPVSYSPQDIPKSNLVLGVNSSGNATGVGYGGPSLSSDAYLFDASTGRSTFISFSSRETSHAQGINDRNAIVVNVMMDGSDGLHHARTVRWEHGVATDLGTLGGNTWGFGINGSNQVVGWFVRTDGNRMYTRAFFHDGQRMSDLGSLDGTCSEAHAVDSAGTPVGSSCAGQTQHAVVFHRGSSIEDLTPDTFGTADGISDGGFIVGRGGPEGFIRPPGVSPQSGGVLPGV